MEWKREESWNVCCTQVTELIHSLACDGTTVCATLHSPTPFTFRLFDRILLLVQGTMVFFGGRGVTSHAANERGCDRCECRGDRWVL